MSVLVEALSLVIPRRVLDARWPGGTEVFLAAVRREEVPGYRACADDRLASVMFLAAREAEGVARMLRAYGAVQEDDGCRFVDFALVDQRGGPVLPCPWLAWRRDPEGFTVAWLAGTAPGTMAAPGDWAAEQSRGMDRTGACYEPGRLLRMSSEEGLETWLDLATGRIDSAVAEPDPTRGVNDDVIVRRMFEMVEREEAARTEARARRRADARRERWATRATVDDSDAAGATGRDEELGLEAMILEMDADVASSRTPGSDHAAIAASDTGDEPWREGPGEEAPPVPRLWPVVRAALEERAWRYDEMDGDAALARVKGSAANYEVFLSVDERLEVLRCWVMLPVRIAEARRGAVCELLNRINFREVGLGSFELDPEDGQPRWRQALDVEGGLLGTTMVHNVIGAGLTYCDRFWAPIVAVGVAGSSLGRALRLVEGD